MAKISAKYEVLYIIDPDLGEEGIAALVEKFKAFDIFYLMTRGGPANSTRTLMYTTYLQAFTNLNYSEAATCAYLIAIIVGILTLVYLRIMRREENI